MKRRIFGMAFMLCVLLAFIQYASAETGTKYGDYLYYEVNQNNTITITDCDTSATEITIPSYINGMSVTTIGDSAFEICRSLTSIYIPESVTLIKNYAFIGCHSLSNVNLPSGITRINQGVFTDCRSLTSIHIPENVTNIGNSAFNRCYSLTDITLHNNITYIDSYAFNNCRKINNITLPDNAWIVPTAFDNCDLLTEINVNNSNSYYSSQDGVLFNKSKTKIIRFPVGKKNTSYTIPNSVTSIGDSAFSGCSSLKNIDIPNSVTEIGGLAFYQCSQLTGINIPNSVTQISLYAFVNCSMLSEASVSSGMSNIPPGTFRGCSSLISVIIPYSITSISDSAFDECSSITDVYYSGTKSEWEKIDISEGNEYLAKANIHYNSPLAPKPISSPIPITQATITKSESSSKWIFNISIAKTYINSYVYAVLYNSSDEIIEINRVPLNTSGDTSIDVIKRDYGKYVKIFIWNDLMQPITEVEKIEL